jgi:ERCC4-type nuclease
MGGIQTWILSPNGKFWKKSKFFKTPMNRYESWLVAMYRAGVIIWRTTSWQHTAHALVYLEKSALVPSTALQRHLKVHDFQPNPYIRQLMGVPDVGVKLAEQLLEMFRTPYRISNQSPEALAELPGIGLPRARAILIGMGREDI